ncbi:MAG: Gfo/Idh/MocA family protein [Candidatus Brocadiia bacterium]
MSVPDPKAQPGPELDWEQFLGDAPKVPFTPSRFFQWRLYWDYAGGPATDLLVHTFTPLFCILGVDYPQRVSGSGGKWHYDGLREVPDTFNIAIDYPGGPTVVLMNTLANATGCQALLRGTRGTIRFEGKRLVIQPHGKDAKPRVVQSKSYGDTGKLWANFVHCVRTRERPLSPVDTAARVQAPLHMAILSHRQGKMARFDIEKQEIVL